MEFNANDGASRIERGHPYVQAAMKMVVRRAAEVGSVETGKLVRGELGERLDEWLAEAQRRTGGSVLHYDRERSGGEKRGIDVPLLQRPGEDAWDDFTCLMSMRDVEPSVGLILDDGGLDDDPEFVLSVADEAEDEEGAE
jgi:hypothetical protein